MADPANAAAIPTPAPEIAADALAAVVLPKTPLMNISEFLRTHLSDLTSSRRTPSVTMSDALQNELLPHFRNNFPKAATGELSLNLEPALIIPGEEPYTGSIQLHSGDKAVAFVRFDAVGQIVDSGEIR